MTFKVWTKRPLWSVSNEVRRVVEASSVGDWVLHYSIPVIEKTGGPQIEDSKDIKSVKLHLNGGEVLVGKLNPRKGRVVHVTPSTQEIVSSTEFVALRPTPEIDRRFLAYALSSETTRQTLDAKVQSATRSHQRVDPEDITHLQLAVPELEEQHRIADFLDTETSRIDKLIGKTGSQISLMEQRFQEIVRQSTTIGTSSAPATSINIPWMPYIHRGWQLHKVSHNFLTGSGTTPASGNPEFFDGNYPWINSADINNGDIYRAQKFVTGKAIEAYSALKIYHAGSLVVALYGQGKTKGKVGILRIDATLNQACCVLRPIGNLSAEYAFYWFRAHKDGIIGLAVGAGQPNLSQELIRQLKVPAPGMEEQLSIVRKLRQEEFSQQARIDKFESRNRLLVERRRALITAAVTGQFDVSSASGRGVEV